MAKIGFKLACIPANLKQMVRLISSVRPEKVLLMHMKHRIKSLVRINWRSSTLSMK